MREELARLVATTGTAERAVKPRVSMRAPVQRIAVVLSCLPPFAFPHAVCSGARAEPSAAQNRAHLKTLVVHDPGVGGGFDPNVGSTIEWRRMPQRE